MLRNRAGASKDDSGLARFPSPEQGYQGLFEHIQTNSVRDGQTLGRFLTNYGQAVEPSIQAAPEFFAQEALTAMQREVPEYELTTLLVNVDTNALARILARIISGSTITFEETG